MRSFLSPHRSSTKKLVVFLLLLVLSSSVLAQGISAEIGAIRDKVIQVACYILVIIEGVVGFLAVLVFVLAALKWIVSDDAHQRAEVKEKLANILVGVVIVILALELAVVIGKAVHIIPSDYPAPCNWSDAIAKTTNIRGIIAGPICVIVRVFQFLFGIIGMIVFMGAGIRWMASEDLNERVKARSIAINVLVGVVLVLIGLNFLNLLFNYAGLNTGVYSGLNWRTLISFDCKEAAFTNLFPRLGLPDTGQLDDVAKYTVCMVFLIIKGVAGVIAVVMVAVAGIFLIISEDSSLRNKAKSLAFSAVVGTIIIIIGSQFLLTLFSPDYRGDASLWSCDPGTEGPIIELIHYTVCTVKNILVAVAGLIATVALLASAFIWITSGSPEARASAKMASIVAVLGLLVTIIGLQYLGSFFGADTLSFECGAGDTEPPIVDLLKTVLCLVYNVLRSVVAVVAAVMVLFGGFMYIVSDSDRDRSRGKGMIAAAIIGFVIALISIQFITVVISGTSLGEISCEDPYKVCVDNCLSQYPEPTPVPAGSGPGPGPGPGGNACNAANCGTNAAGCFASPQSTRCVGDECLFGFTRNSGLVCSTGDCYCYTTQPCDCATQTCDDSGCSGGTIESCVDVCAANYGSCGDLPHDCDDISYCMPPAANCQLTYGSFPSHCASPTPNDLIHDTDGDADCVSRYEIGYQCCCCP